MDIRICIDDIDKNIHAYWYRHEDIGRNMDIIWNNETEMWRRTDRSGKRALESQWTGLNCGDLCAFCMTHLSVFSKHLLSRHHSNSMGVHRWNAHPWLRGIHIGVYVLVPVARSPVWPDYCLKASITSPRIRPGIGLGLVLKKASLPVEASLPQASIHQHILGVDIPGPGPYNPALETLALVPVQGAVGPPVFGIRAYISAGVMRWDFQGGKQKNSDWKFKHISMCVRNF